MAEISRRPITAGQVRAIHVAISRSGIDDETYRGLLRERYDVSTCKALTRRQASEFLSRLGRPLPRPPGTGRPRAERPPRLSAGVARLATQSQRALIEELRARVEWREPGGYARWLRTSFGFGRVATSAEAGRVVEGLKAMVRRGDP